MRIMAYAARKKRTKAKVLVIGRLVLGYTVAKPGTLWWRSPSTDIRRDALLALDRTYIRSDRMYFYTVTLGRFMFDIAWKVKK